MAFRLTSSNGSVTYASFNAARTGDIAFAGALTWTVDQAGNGAGVNTAGMAYTSLLVTVSPGIRHQGVRVTDLTTVANIQGQFFIGRPGTTIEWMTAGGVQGEFTWQNSSGITGICRNCVFQDQAVNAIELINNTSPVTVAFENNGYYDDGTTVWVFLQNTTGVADVVGTLNIKHCSNYSVNPFTAVADTGGVNGRNVHATMNCTNCINTNGAVANFAEDESNGGTLSIAVCNTTNCVYAAIGKVRFPSGALRGTDTNPLVSTNAAEFVSSTDMYTPKAGARRNGAGTAAAGVTNDILGIPYGAPPNVGFAAPQRARGGHVLVVSDDRLARNPRLMRALGVPANLTRYAKP